MNAPPKIPSLAIVWFTFALVIAHASSAEETIPPKPARAPVKLPGILIDLEQGYVDLKGAIRVNVDPHFYYTVPNKTLATKITKPTKLQGTHTPIEIGNWSEVHRVIEKVIE